MHHTSVFATKLYLLDYLVIMASPGSLKGQGRGTCGHAMAAFDLHEKCARCREKKVGEDQCVKGLSCSICEGFSEAQRETLSTPSYKIRKEIRAGSLVSPKDITIIGSVESEDQASVQPIAHPPAQGPSTSQLGSFVTSAQFEEMNDKWAEHFARFEALLSRGNVFSTPKSSAPGSSHPVLSDQPFLNPSARATGPVGPLAEPDLPVRCESKTKKKSKKSSKSNKSKDIPVPDQPAPASDFPEPGVLSQEPVFRPVSSVAASTGRSSASTGTVEQSAPPVPQPGPEKLATGPPSQPATETVTASSVAFTGSGGVSFIPEQAYRNTPGLELSEEDNSEAELSGGEEEGELSSDGLEKQEQTEDLTFRETVRSIRSFMGWDYIPVFESDLAEPDKSNNPWRGKHPRKPARISVAMPPDDWLCQKLEKLNTTVAEGYPSRAQDAAGLKKDQFVKIPKSQSRWYQMYTVRQEGPHRPGKNLFSWTGSEAKVNSQFPRIIKASSYSPSGPPSRPISQEYLRRWERCAKEGTYVVNSAAGFNRCASQLQDCISASVGFVGSRISKGKSPKEVTEAFRDIKDLLAFHHNVSLSMGTALQHLADSLFVNLSNLILLRRDSYLEHVRPGIKPDTWNMLRNAPMFGYGLFPDTVLNTAEQDINKYESAGVAPGPGPGASQRSNWRGNFRYKPYDKRGHQRGSQQHEQEQQPWRQFSRSANRGRGRGRGNPRFSKSRGLKTYK